jgi:DJ-1/PfpI family
MRTEILIFDGFDELDAFGPYEVLAEAGFEVALVTHPASDRVATARGAVVVPDRPLSDRAELLVVPGGGWTRRPPKGAWAEVQRGVLPPAITHWQDVGDLEAMGIRVIRDARVVDDGDIMTAGGVTSGIDLALWTVEQENGREAADAVAAELEHRRDERIWRAVAT